ncbi:hypothetical protein WN51_04471 [Melipona quadrifasciata]|uniref:Uncharacterized protein n=1 Tax=Melipona quadrifasciata TaxID=166423 RepID=A0A0M8ZU02_9HYME|nr:hypothetical protein WN51_04471 [Melipona quadrifasciata]
MNQNLTVRPSKNSDIQYREYYVDYVRPRIPQIRVSNTRLAQAASGCAPSVDVLPIFDVKQQSVRNPARLSRFYLKRAAFCEVLDNSVTFVLDEPPREIHAVRKVCPYVETQVLALTCNRKYFPIKYLNVRKADRDGVLTIKKHRLNKTVFQWNRTHVAKMLHLWINNKLPINQKSKASISRFRNRFDHQRVPSEQPRTLKVVKGRASDNPIYVLKTKNKNEAVKAYTDLGRISPRAHSESGDSDKGLAILCIEGPTLGQPSKSYGDCAVMIYKSIACIWESNEKKEKNDRLINRLNWKVLKSGGVKIYQHLFLTNGTSIVYLFNKIEKLTNLTSEKIGIGSAANILKISILSEFSVPLEPPKWSEWAICNFCWIFYRCKTRNMINSFISMYEFQGFGHESQTGYHKRNTVTDSDRGRILHSFAQSKNNFFQNSNPISLDYYCTDQVAKLSFYKVDLITSRTTRFEKNQRSANLTRSDPNNTEALDLRDPSHQSSRVEQQNPRIGTTRFKGCKDLSFQGNYVALLKAALYLQIILKNFKKKKHLSSPAYTVLRRQRQLFLIEMKIETLTILGSREFELEVSRAVVGRWMKRYTARIRSSSPLHHRTLLHHRHLTRRRYTSSAGNYAADAWKSAIYLRRYTVLEGISILYPLDCRSDKDVFSRCIFCTGRWLIFAQITNWRIFFVEKILMDFHNCTAHLRILASNASISPNTARHPRSAKTLSSIKPEDEQVHNRQASANVIVALKLLNTGVTLSKIRLIF